MPRRAIIAPFAVVAFVGFVLLGGASSAAAITPRAAAPPAVTGPEPPSGSERAIASYHSVLRLFRRLSRRAVYRGRRLTTAAERRRIERRAKKWSKRRVVNWYCDQWSDWFGRQRYGTPYAIRTWVSRTHYYRDAYASYWYCFGQRYLPIILYS